MEFPSPFLHHRRRFIQIASNGSQSTQLSPSNVEQSPPGSSHLLPPPPTSTVIQSGIVDWLASFHRGIIRVSRALHPSMLPSLLHFIRQTVNRDEWNNQFTLSDIGRARNNEIIALIPIQIPRIGRRIGRRVGRRGNKSTRYYTLRLFDGHILPYLLDYRHFDEMSALLIIFHIMLL